MSGTLRSFPCSMKICINVYINHTFRTYAAKKSITQLYRSQFYPQFPEAPYDFVCQVGDPILRQKCDKVDESLINTPAFQELISHMWKVHESYKCAGLSAPQIGLPLQIAVIGGDVPNIKNSPPVPHRVLINPTVKVINYKSKIALPEICSSVCSFMATVSRYTDIRVEALNEKGVKQIWDALGFEACVIQHEVDHLEGTMYVDKMDPKTLECVAWQQINANKGKCSISYQPQKTSILDRFKLF